MHAFQISREKVVMKTNIEKLRKQGHIKGMK